MKKLALTIAIVLGLGVSAFADGGLFQRSYNAENGRSGYLYFGQQASLFRESETPQPLMPLHALEGDQDAPIGSGIVMLMGLGAAYLVGKKRREE